MPRLQTVFVLGYHGCDAAVGESILGGDITLARSEKAYDWLGPGAYFWESDPQRAWEWADARKKQKQIDKAFVVGAIIDLGNCIDLFSRDSLALLAEAHSDLKAIYAAAPKGAPFPENKGGDSDKLLRYLDCAVINVVHASQAKKGLEPFDTVRGLFTEGDELYQGSGFKKKTHIQIAACRNECIKGFFRVSRAAQ
jgi:hypothetical protein